MPLVTAAPSWQPIDRSLAAVAGDAWAVFGLQVQASGRPGGPAAVRWLMRRNLSIAPRQLLWVYLALCFVTLAVAAFFLSLGAPWVMAFAGLELLALGLAFLLFARHATDHELLTLIGSSLQLERHSGSSVQRAELDAHRVTVEPARGQGSLVKLTARGQSIEVGRFLRPELRLALAQELRRALRRNTAADPQSLN